MYLKFLLIPLTLAELAGANHETNQPLDRRQTSSYNRTLAYSPPFYPSPWMNPKAIGWEEAYSKAKDFVSQMTLLEKVNLTTGVGYMCLQHHLAKTCR